MAHGAVVVGWRMPELVEILHDDLSAWLVTEGKTAELAERVRRLIDNPALMLAGIQASRERASHFTPQRMQTQLHGLYNDLLGMKTVADDPTTGSCSIMSTPR
jgi:glycosyltransferase involved in cell wall biosynthesis